MIIIPARLITPHPLNEPLTDVPSFDGIYRENVPKMTISGQHGWTMTPPLGGWTAEPWNEGIEFSGGTADPWNEGDTYFGGYADFVPDTGLLIRLVR